MSEATLPLSTKRRLAALAVLLGLVLWAAPEVRAATNPSDEGCNQDDVCREHFVQGKALYKQQDYTNALQEFQSAYERRQTPILLANIGRTLQKLGRPREALDYYLRCQEASRSDAELQDRLKVYIAETKALLAVTAPAARPDENKEPPPAALAAPLASSEPAKTPPQAKPIYKKGWFWAVIGVGAAVVIGGVVTGVVLATRPQADPALDPGVTVIRPMF